jgi:hypothetical protein
MRTLIRARRAAAALVLAAAGVMVTVAGPAHAGGVGATCDVQPTVTAVTPDYGPAAGGNASTIITGTGFYCPSGAVNTASVLFGTVAVTVFVVHSATDIGVTVPAQAAGTVNVTVSTPEPGGGGTSPISPADQYTYVGPLSVTTTSLPAASVGQAYSATLAATGGLTPYSWSVTSGALPLGLSLSSAGVISGTPEQPGTASFTVTAADSESPPQTANADLSITTGGCTETVSGTYSGPLTVSSGQVVCAGAGGSITGPVRISAGGELALSGASISGPLTASGAGLLSLCGSTVSGPVRVSGSTGPVMFGNGVGCAADTINGPATFTSNTGGVTLAGNTISGPLGCTSNSPAPSDAGDLNSVSGPQSGQCAAPF